jgi:hypothetical protein
MAIPVPESGDANGVQVELLRAASVTQRVARARSLSTSVISLARRAVRRRHPGLSEVEVLLRFAELHYGQELAGRIRQYLARRGE